MKIWVYRIFLILCISSVVGFILYNSTRTSEQSAQISHDIADKIVQVVDPEVEELEEELKEKKKYNANAFLRDVAHVVEYITLTFFVALLAFTIKFRYGRYPIAFMLVLLGCFVFAACDELLQGTCDGRVSQISDVVIDMLGVVIGLFVACIVDFTGLCIIRRKESKFV